MKYLPLKWEEIETRNAFWVKLSEQLTVPVCNCARTQWTEVVPHVRTLRLSDYNASLTFRSRYRSI